MTGFCDITMFESDQTWIHPQTLNSCSLMYDQFFMKNCPVVISVSFKLIQTEDELFQIVQEWTKNCFGFIV